MRYLLSITLVASSLWCSDLSVATLQSLQKGNLMFRTSVAFCWFKQQLSNVNLLNRLRTIKLIILDIDGSLTNGTMEYQTDREGARYFSIIDGYGIKATMNAGLTVAFLSGKNCASGKKRAQVLGIPDNLCILGSEDKRPVVTALQQQLNIAAEHSIMYGDDILDAQVKQDAPATFFVCPSNSPFYIQALSDLTLPFSGGSEHACRLMLDLILYVQEKHPMQQVIYAIMQ